MPGVMSADALRGEGVTSADTRAGAVGSLASSLPEVVSASFDGRR